MARMNQDGLSGLVGNLVFYTMNGKSYVRSRPKYSKTKQKQLSNSGSAQLFGQVSRCASAVLSQLQTKLLFPLKRDAYNQFRSWLLRQYKARAGSAAWPISCMPNDQCQLQSFCDLRDVFRVQVSAEDLGGGQLRIIIPAWNPMLQLSAPPGTRNLLIRIMACDVSFAARSPIVSSGMAEITLPFTKELQPASETLLQLEGQKDDLLFLSLSLGYETLVTPSGSQLTDTAWLPAAVLGVGRRKE
jgi:hypothetical protein